ncbi:MAG: superoxide reductase [Tissierellia bacterium]|nr:superoxide reductase [Tissierellia bacterium]
MKGLGSLYQSGDWKGEKHVPVILCPDKVKEGEVIELKVNIGEEISHPNTLEHYISWIKVYYKPEGGNYPVEVGSCDFAAHGEYGVLTQPDVTLRFEAEKSGTIFAASYCNIHGLWESSKELVVEK